MSNTKSWYMSRTVWASLVTILLSVAGLAGVPTDGVDGSVLTDTLVEAITAISGLVAIVARISATTRLK